MDTTTKTDVKRERFVRIAERRVNAILDTFDKLENCSNVNNYRYYESDVKKIFGEIEKRLKDVKSKFTDPPSRKTAFKLSD
jgi:hypothetical protein